MKTNRLNQLIICILVISSVGCSSQTKETTQESTPVEEKTPIRKEVPADKVQSISVKTHVLKDSTLGQFFGHFKPTPIVVRLQQRYDSLEAAIVDDNDYFTIDDRFYNSTNAEEKKQFYLDPLYGVHRLRKPNALSIIFQPVTIDSIIGRSICAGNERPLKMKSVTDDGDTLRMVLEEPGDDKYDGRFEVKIAENSGILTGQFHPYDKKFPIKTLVANNAEFKYQPKGDEWAFDKDYLGKNISLELLTEEDVENQSKQRLRILRNIIYARHGYSFKNKDVREFFESYDWYVPFSTDVRSELTDIEKTNIALIKRYETYAEDYYDDFGR